MLVPWGLFAQRIGLVEALEGVAIPQRTRDHTPQTKLIEFLVSILTGCAHLKDISHGPHPLDQDVAVAQAWGQQGWADHSGVSRTLKACTGETIAAVKAALDTVLQPFIAREVMLALRDQGALIYDGDLTVAALEMALLQRQSHAGLIHHSDQGSQYTDQALLKGRGIRASMNDAGSWYDNAPMESFFGTLKSELVHHCVYHTRDEAKADVFYYIDSFYNRRRRPSALDYLSPEAYEQIFHRGVLTLA